MKTEWCWSVGPRMLLNNGARRKSWHHRRTKYRKLEVQFGPFYSKLQIEVEA